jgi:ParB-like chromosome segregation protein Spo0J
MNTLTLRPAQPYEYHPFSDIWPLLEGEDFDKLALDIAAHGLKLPILLYQDKVLDGRNRDRACVEAGVEPRYEQSKAATDEEALELVFSLNHHRRHLSFQEKAFAAARYANLKQGSNQYYSRESSRELSSGKSVSIDDAAKKFEISPASVKRARTVIKHGDKQLEKDVKQGKVHLRIAAERVAPKKKKPGERTRDYGLPAAARVPVIDTSKRRILTPEQVDPEFTGTSNEFTTKYGHVQLETAEERATNRFQEWTQHIRRWARDWKQQGPLTEIDVNWLRSPHQKDVDHFLEAYKTLAVVFDNIQSIRDKVLPLKKKNGDKPPEIS